MMTPCITHRCHEHVNQSSTDHPGRRCCRNNRPQDKAEGLKERSIR
jgi:hypothetical protein